MKHNNRIIESMTKFILDGHWDAGYVYIVRVWRNEENLKDEYDKKDLIEFVGKSYKKYYKNLSKLAEVVGEFKRVNAVEVINPNTGEGIVYYPNWP